MGPKESLNIINLVLTLKKLFSEGSMKGRDDVNPEMKPPINPVPTFLIFENLPPNPFLLHHVITSEKEQKSSDVPKERHWMMLCNQNQFRRN